MRQPGLRVPIASLLTVAVLFASPQGAALAHRAHHHSGNALSKRVERRAERAMRHDLSFSMTGTSDATIWLKRSSKWIRVRELASSAGVGSNKKLAMARFRLSWTIRARGRHTTVKTSYAERGTKVADRLAGVKGWTCATRQSLKDMPTMTPAAFTGSGFSDQSLHSKSKIRISSHGRSWFVTENASQGKERIQLSIIVSKRSYRFTGYVGSAREKTRTVRMRMTMRGRLHVRRSRLNVHVPRCN